MSITTTLVTPIQTEVSQKKPPMNHPQISSSTLLYATSIAYSSAALMDNLTKYNFEAIKQGLFLYKTWNKLSQEKQPLSFKELSLEKGVKRLHALTALAVLPFAITKTVEKIQRIATVSQTMLSIPNYKILPDTLETPLENALKVLSFLTVVKGCYSVKDSFGKMRKATDSPSFYKAAALTTEEALKHLLKVASDLFPGSGPITKPLQHVAFIALNALHLNEEKETLKTLSMLQNLPFDQVISISGPINAIEEQKTEQATPETGAVTKI